MVKKDTTAHKEELFAKYLRRLWGAAFVYGWVERKAGRIQVAAFVYWIFVYWKACGFKRTHTDLGRDLLTLVLIPNETRALAHSISEKTQTRLRQLRPRLWHLNFSDWLVGASWLTAWRILQRLKRRGFKPYVVLRAAEFLAYYARLQKFLSASPGNFRYALIFTDGNPHGLALLHAAKRNQVSTAFISHGEPAAPVYPLKVEMAYLKGPMSLQLYLESGGQIAKPLFQGEQERWHPIRATPNAPIRKVGIFLSKSSSREGVDRACREISAEIGAVTFLLRGHPNWESSGRLEDDVAQCDLIFAGNSTVHLEILLLGCASIYMHRLDDGEWDRQGYVREGLILDWDQGPRPILPAIAEFYSDPRIQKKLQFHLALDQSATLTREQLNAHFL